MSDKDKFLFHTADDGAVKVEVLYKEEAVWLTQKALSELFGVRVPAVNVSVTPCPRFNKLFLLNPPLDKLSTCN